MSGLTLRSTGIVFVLLASLGVARADLIIQNQGVGLNGGPSAFDTITFEPFDTSLGQLDEAIFTASLNLQLVMNTVPVVPPEGGSINAHVVGTASLFIDGLTWPFAVEATCLTNRSVVSGESATFPILLNMTWRSDADSDLFGFTIGDGSATPCNVNPINPVHRGDYLATPLTAAAGLLTDIRSLWGVSSTTGGAALTAGGGFMQLQYNYTPVIVTVPEPAAGLLFSLALVCMGYSRRKQVRLPPPRR